LPLLRLAKQVTVVEITEAGSSRAAAASGVRDVVAWLARHGIAADERVSAGEYRDPTAPLDDIAGEIGAGLIVAGAYGHSRFRELVLGGMTQHLINQSARCVLLSH
jgi:nucleotide-binding universal stress UspA family protein